MSEVDYAIVISSLRPGAQWSLSGNSYEGLVWLDDSTPPTREECESAWGQAEAAAEEERVSNARKEAYRLESDPLYFHWKSGEGSEEEWLSKRNEIKARLPRVQETSQ